MLQGVIATSFTTPGEAAPSLNAFFEKREVQVARFDAKDYAGKVNPTDADLDAYYKAHPDQFQAPEQATVEYLVLDLDSVMKGITVNESDLKTYYEQNKAKYAQVEQRHASHILIAVAKGAPPADKDKAKARAQELLAEQFIVTNPACTRTPRHRDHSMSRAVIQDSPNLRFLLHYDQQRNTNPSAPPLPNLEGIPPVVGERHVDEAEHDLELRR